MSLACPLCSVLLIASALEAHLRFELAFPLLRCELCKESFCDRSSAAHHFRGPFAKHPGRLEVGSLRNLSCTDTSPQLMQPPEDVAKSGRLLELIRLARGGEEAVQQRICVCGHCRLLCRDDFRPTTGAPQSSAEDAAKPLPQERVALSHLASQEQMRSGPAASWPPQAPMEDPSHPMEVKQPAEEEQKGASEEETPTPMDVKPNLADLKPQLVSDGKVSCLQCGTRADKNHFSEHAQLKHMPGKPFQCLLCPLHTKQRSELAKHQKKEHGAVLSPETYTSSLNKEALKDWIKLCFGEVKNVGYIGSRCRTCDVHVASQNIKQHVAKYHLKKPLHKCRECGKQSSEVSPSLINNHVKKVHKGIPGPETIDSSALEQYEPIIKAMIPQLFEK